MKPPVRKMEPEDWLPLEWELSALFSGAPVDEESLFAGRTTEVRRILEAMFDRSRHAVLYGERGVGKTSIANVFWRRYNTTLRTVIAARVQADPSDTFSSLWTKAIDEFVSVAKQIGRHDLAPLDANILMETPDQVRREFQKCKPNASPVIIIDEYDQLRDSNARLLTANVIKYLYDYGVNVTVILVGVAEDVTQLVADHESIDRALLPIKLNRMSDNELGEVIDTRLSRTPVRISGDARWTIITLSRGLPYFTQMLAKHAAISAVRDRKTLISVSHVEAAMERFIADSEHRLQEAYRLATESPQKDASFKEVLLACALSITDTSGFFSPTDVIDPLNTVMGTGSKKRHAHFQRHLTEFLSDNRGRVLVRRGAERQYRYRFSDPMVQPYVIIRGIQERLIPEESRKLLLEREQPQLPM